MGHPNGEREKSEASDQIINRRAEMAFQVYYLKLLGWLKFTFLQKMDLDQDGVITLEEFMTTCLEDKKMTQSFYSIDIAQNM
jgi:hypothetical protein